MTYISCGLNQEFIIDLLEKTTEEGVSFKYEGKTGIKLASVSYTHLDVYKRQMHLLPITPSP